MGSLAVKMTATEGDLFESLTELALNLRGSWNHATDQLWRELDPLQWQLTHNPWGILQTASRCRLRQVFAEPDFRARVEQLIKTRRASIESPAWFQEAHPGSPLRCAAYFSMEFMLGEALPIYSGGLGNVAGDQLKAASDLGVPVIGVGLLYAQGYFRQTIDGSGAQQALHPYNDPGQLPILPLRRADGEWLRLEISFPGYSVWLRAWQVNVGRAKLYLLDSNDMANQAAFRGVTSELYGGGPELRLQQELLLGIGGWRLLHALNLQPEVCHLNEGHAAFAILERAGQYMKAAHVPFDAALAVTRAGNIFTTHTAVAAGFDRFAPRLLEQYLGRYAREVLQLPMHQLLGLGRQNPDDESEPFNMAYLAIRGSGRINGVSRLHGDVSRRLFQRLFPRRPLHEVPIGHVTNGIHTPSWDCAEADVLWTTYCGKDRWLGGVDGLAERVRGIPDAALWSYRTAARRSMIGYVRERLATQWAASGRDPAEVELARSIFSEDALTLGFARRFATYKRPNLLLQDPQRLLRLLTDPQRPVQLLMAGKAHPADAAGQALILEWNRYIRGPELRSRVIFLSDYDMLLTERLVQGVDVWINTPQRPWEACGTSGMKVLVNGGLNLSELDGWWAEAYRSELGWALGDGRSHDGDPAWDERDAAQLYDVLENQVVPEFYARDAGAIPAAWVARVRESMASLTPVFSANRSVREYVEDGYLPAAAAYRARVEEGGALGASIARWRHDIDVGWPALRFGRVHVSHSQGLHEFTVEVILAALQPAAIRVELYGEGKDAAPPICREMHRISTTAESGRLLYAATVVADRDADAFTARIVPAYPGVSVPLEAGNILWQR